jgi:hypothetical protein
MLRPTASAAGASGAEPNHPALLPDACDVSPRLSHSFGRYVNGSFAPKSLLAWLPWLLCLAGSSACRIDESVNPAYGCDPDCTQCVRGFCYDTTPLDAAVPIDAAAPDAAEAGPVKLPPCEDAGAEQDAGPVRANELCDACGGKCSQAEVCCHGECAEQCIPVCGNGFMEEGEECDGDAFCTPECSLRFARSLIHRYTFEGSGRTAADSIGTADGTIKNARLRGTGSLDLAGGTTDQYVDLPNGLIRGLSSVTIEVWATWSGTTAGQHLFDFGFNDAGQNEQSGMATSYLYVTPLNASGTIGAYVNFTRMPGDVDEDRVAKGDSALSTGVMHQIVVVFNGSGDAFLLYVDGARLDLISGVSGMLAQIDDRNVWIGRANSPAESFRGTIHEFRIYSEALGDSAIRESHTAGPDP